MILRKLATPTSSTPTQAVCVSGGLGLDATSRSTEEQTMRSVLRVGGFISKGLQSMRRWGHSIADCISG